MAYGKETSSVSRSLSFSLSFCLSLSHTAKRTVPAICMFMCCFTLQILVALLKPFPLPSSLSLMLSLPVYLFSVLLSSFASRRSLSSSLNVPNHNVLCLIGDQPKGERSKLKKLIRGGWRRRRLYGSGTRTSKQRHASALACLSWFMQNKKSKGKGDFVVYLVLCHMQRTIWRKTIGKSQLIRFSSSRLTHPSCFWEKVLVRHLAL